MNASTRKRCAEEIAAIVNERQLALHSAARHPMVSADDFVGILARLEQCEFDHPHNEHPCGRSLTDPPFAPGDGK